MTRSISRWKCEQEKEEWAEQAVAAVVMIWLVVTMLLKNWLPLVENAMRYDDKLLVLFNKSFDLGLTFADAAWYCPSSDFSIYAVHAVVCFCSHCPAHST